MKVFLVCLITLGTFLTEFSNAQIQCAVDVQIVEGDAITMCESNPQTISGSAGFVNYAWSGPESQVSQTITPNFSGQYILAALDGTGCVSVDTINVTIIPTPVEPILSSEGNPICSGTGTTLSLGNAYSSYLWTGGATTATLFAPSIGTYDVSYTDANGCTGSSSITLTEVQFTLTGSESSLCTGGAVTLTATGGEAYVWSTGEVGNTIVVNPSSATLYSVVITLGSCSQTLSTTVTPAEPEENLMPDTVYVGSGEAAFISGPAGFESYLWSPSNQINNPFAAGVIFSGTVSQTLVVDATHEDGCVLSDSVVVIVVDLTIPNGFSPNSDGKNDVFRIPQLDDYPASFSVWNRWGDMVLDDPSYQNNWDGTCQTATCLGSGELPEGTYFYLVDVEGITFKGYITLKR
ncbi:MAG: gliding motility-associated C-terminal domain-containing protein [Crocinitomicaceae bacterium]|nr:gliding motility-associated C-terminal domain-containing protein [Crocinitomicaceae bacterium]